ncbi:MAG: class I SAM-dependent methyltransferase [Anaerolineae bacterium]
MADNNESVKITRELLAAIFGSKPPFTVKLWDGSVWPDDNPRPAALLLQHPGALRAMFLPGGELGLGEAYLYDDFDIEGSVEQLFTAAQQVLAAGPSLAEKLHLAALLRQLPNQSRREAALKAQAGGRGRAHLSGKVHSLERDKAAIRYHYNVSNEFYALFLDPQMVYSCAYFKSADKDLAAAQEDKLDYICRKLRLRPGQRLLDIGCGWGALALHAAAKYGVDATGITLSQPQVDLANERIRQAGLSERCRVLLQDYRELPADGSYDALVSVGMFEHVGAALLPAYFKQAYDLLKPGGVFLNHGIAMRGSDTAGRIKGFSESYVFPDGELAPLHTTLTCAEKVFFEVRDVESLREHYMLTLRRWVRRLESNHEEALKHVTEPVYRVWRLYMSGSAEGFASGRNTVYQMLLLKPTGAPSGLPLTRADWYA